MKFDLIFDIIINILTYYHKSFYMPTMMRGEVRCKV